MRRSRMALQRPGLRVLALAALATCAAGAPFTFVANVVSHSIVRVGGSVAHPQPQVTMLCPDHPGLQCRTSVNGNQVIINVFHDSAVEQRWTDPNTETNNKEPSDRDGQEDEDIEETIEETYTPEPSFDWDHSKPDRVLNTNDISENSEDIETPKPENVHEREHESNEQSSGRNSHNAIDEYDTEDSLQDNRNSQFDETSDEGNEDFDRYLETNDDTTPQTSYTQTEYGQSNSDQDPNYENNDDNDYSNTGTTPDGTDVLSNDDEESHVDSSHDHMRNTENSEERTAEFSENKLDDNNDDAENGDENEYTDRENSQDIALSEITTSKPLLTGKWWPTW